MIGANKIEREPIDENKSVHARVDRVAFAVGQLSEIHTRHADAEHTMANIKARQKLLDMPFEEAKEIEAAVQKEEVRLAQLFYNGTFRLTDTKDHAIS